MGKFQLPEQFWTSKNDQNDDTKGLFGSTGLNGIQWVEFPYQIHSETTSRVTGSIHKFGFDPNLATSPVVRTAVLI